MVPFPPNCCLLNNNDCLRSWTWSCSRSSLQGSHQPGVRGFSRDQGSSAQEKGTRLDDRKRDGGGEGGRRSGDGAIGPLRGSRVQELLLSGTVARGEAGGNSSIRYSFTRPRCIYSVASVTTSCPSRPCLFRWKEREERGGKRRRACPRWGEMKRYGAARMWASLQPTMHCTASAQWLMSCTVSLIGSLVWVCVHVSVCEECWVWREALLKCQWGVYAIKCAAPLREDEMYEEMWKMLLNGCGTYFLPPVFLIFSKMPLSLTFIR